MKGSWSAAAIFLSTFFVSFGSASAENGTPSSPAGDQYRWVTLGTLGGPMPNAKRSEPANMLLKAGALHLVDAGDNAATRMVLGGGRFDWLNSVFISHLHFDHIGGLYAVLGLRSQLRITTPLTIYGPPGTKEIVAGLVAAMTPSAKEGYGIPGEKYVALDANLTVVELTDGSIVKLSDVTVTAAANSHFSFPPGSTE